MFGRWLSILAARLLLAVILTTISFDVLAIPMSGDAALLAAELREIIGHPIEERSLNEELSAMCAAAARGQDMGAQIVAILALAYASDASSLEELDHLAQSHNTTVAGAAKYAVTVRGASGMNLDQRLRRKRPAGDHACRQGRERTNGSG